MTKLQEAMTSVTSQVLSRLAMLAMPLLLAALAWYFTGANAATQRALEAVQAANVAISTQLAGLSIQLARLEEQAGGRSATQAAIDAEQNRRLDRLEARASGE
ncbi:MAG: hypothetical protein AB7O56_09580 [Bauldia sp.]